MEIQGKKLSAAADPAMQNMLRQAMENVAGQMAKRTNRLSDAIESQRHETPMLITTLTASEEPARAPGMLWFVVNNGLLYFYNQTFDLFLGVAPVLAHGNNNVVNISGSIYALTRAQIPAGVLLETISVAFFSPGNITGRLDAYSVGGNSLGGANFSISAGNYGEATLTLNRHITVAFGLEVRVTLFSGSLPETAAYAKYRLIP